MKPIWCRARFVAASGSLRTGTTQTFVAAPRVGLNQWTLAGSWNVGAQQIELIRPGGRIALRFHARDLHLVLGPAREGRPVRFKIRIDGKAPGADRGTDVDADGEGCIEAQRLYQLVRQGADGRERLFQIEFLDGGARAYAFTFG